MQLEPVGHAHVAETSSHERVVPENRTMILEKAVQLKLLLQTSGGAGSSCVAAATRNDEVQNEQS